MADPNQWGSLVWKILHIQSEYLGRQSIQLLQKDELLLINKFLKQIYHILPCLTCKKHYNEYYHRHNIKEIKYNNIHTFLVKYFFDLHNSINERNNKPLFKEEELVVYNSYTRSQYTTIIKQFEQLFKKEYAIHYYISIDAVNDFLVILRKLRALSNF